MGNALLVRGIEILGQSIVDIRQQTVADPRLVLEVAVVRVARREARTSVETLLERVERLERQLAAGGGVSGGGGGGGAAAPSPRPAGPEAAPEPASAAPTDARDPVLSRRAAKAPKAEAAAADDAPPVAEAAAPESFDPDDVIEAWPTVLEGLKAPLKAVVQHAQPIGVERGIVVFGVPRPRFDAINGRFRSEAETIKEAFSSQLGFAPRFVLRPHDFDAPGALRPVVDAVGAVGAASGAAAVVDVTEDEPEIDLNELVDAPDAPPPDTVARLVSDLGAQVVEERPRS